MGRRIGPGGIETSGYVVEWQPPTYTVDDRGKVVGGFVPELHNWGRWGDDDQRGTANLITPDLIAAAVALVERGDVFSLSLTYGKDGPRWPERPVPLHTYSVSGSDLVVGHPRLDGFHLQFTDDFISMALQDTTQMDGLAHVAYQDVMYNGYWAGNVTADGGARFLGIQKQIESYIGRGVLLDLPRHLGVDALPSGFDIEPSLLTDVADAQGSSLQPGDIVMYRTGHLTSWSPESMSVTDKMEWFFATPRLTPACVGWVAAHDLAAVCTDTVSPDGVRLQQEFGPYDTAQPFHVGAIVGLGLGVGELFNFESLAEACANDGRYTMFVSCPPLNFPGAAGSPLNPVAIR